MVSKRPLIAVQYTLDGGSVEIRKQSRISALVFSALRPMAEANVVRCENYGCRLPISKRKAQQHWLYEPFDETPDITYWCVDCYEDYSPDGEFFCDGCGRDIYGSNGYRLNYKLDAEHGDMICVRCYQEGIFEHGHTRAELESGQVKMDWYNHSDLYAHGFEPFERIYCLDIPPEKALARWQEIVGERMSAGFMCATDQGPTGLGNGAPDWVEVWTKPISPEQRIAA